MSTNTNKLINLEEDGKLKLVQGVNALADAVKTTLGPKGKNVIIQKVYGSPSVTKDGVSVAKEIFLKDNLMNMGAQLVKEVASKTGDIAGDGTTTATVLTQAIINEGMKFLAAGINPMDMKRGIDLACEKLVNELNDLSQPCETKKEITQVAMISSNSDEKIGSIVAEAIHKVGKDGVVTIEDGRSLENELEVVDGMQFDNGYLSPYFITNPDKQLCELENPLILVCDQKIEFAEHIVPALDAIATANRSLVIIADSIEGEALSTLVLNHMKGTIKACAVKAPGYGDRRKQILQDIAILTGATVVGNDFGIDFEHVRLEHLGSAEKVDIGKEKTIVIDGKGNKDQLEARITHIRKSVDEVSSEYDKERLKERAAKLEGGVAVIRVGASTETEMQEKKDRFDDALNASRAAVQEGIVPGGGIALIRAKSVLNEFKGSNLDQSYGIETVANAIEAPLKQILKNAGYSVDIVFKNIMENDKNYGFDASSNIYGDMLEIGIVDPTKVVKTALLNAASVSGLILTMGCAISFDEEDLD